MNNVGNRAGVVFQSNHVIEQTIGGEDGVEWKIKDGEVRDITCKARSYNAFSGFFLKLLGFAVKIDGTYYNCKSLAKRMAQEMLHSSVESESRRDRRDIKNIEVIWKKALTEIKNSGKEFGANQLATIYNNTLETAKEEFAEDRLDAKYILLQPVENQEKSLLAFIFESITGEDESPSLIDGLNQAYGYEPSTEFDSEYIIKEDWFKHECLKKDKNGIYQFAKVFEGVHTLDQNNLRLIIDILKELKNEQLVEVAMDKSKEKFDPNLDNWTEPQMNFFRDLNNLLNQIRG